MTTRKGETGTRSGPVGMGSRLLRLLRSDTGLQADPIGVESPDQEDGYGGCVLKEIGSAMLDAEYRRAQAIMMVQQHRSYR